MHTGRINPFAAVVIDVVAVDGVELMISKLSDSCEQLEKPERVKIETARLMDLGGDLSDFNGSVDGYLPLHKKEWDFGGDRICCCNL